jgi:hypothetical protein
MLFGCKVFGKSFQRAASDRWTPLKSEEIFSYGVLLVRSGSALNCGWRVNHSHIMSEVSF